MKYIVYILLSEKVPKTYVDHTDNIERRVNEHNSGKSVYTRRHKPWKVLYTEVFDSEQESIKKEKYLKSAAGRRWIKKVLF